MHRFIIFICLVFILSACASTKAPFKTPQASGYYGDEPIQCVHYARKVSGFPIYGDAYTWWYQTPAEKRSSVPQKGAVLVLSKTKKLTRGHLAVVKDIISPRRILVTHSNWGYDHDTRRIIYETMLVEDISAINNWSRLRFWNKEINSFGLPYEAYGFIYK